jgi:hypothetical protein
MQISIHTPTIPPTSPLTSTSTTAGSRQKIKYPITPLPRRLQPPCTLCKKYEHPINKFPSLPELCNLIQLPREPPPLVASSSTTAISPNTNRKGLGTKFASAIYSKYGHYTHHCPALPQFWQMITTVRHRFQQEPTPTHVTNIHYVTTSVNERMRCHCSLCESLDHFTYQCPMII